jgi:hypothetical protein
MKLLKYILLVVIVSISLLAVILGLYRQGQNKFLKVKNPVKEMLYGNENYDILFIGSSRTTWHVNPRIIDSITNLNSYNAGHYGANIVEINLMLQCYLEKHIPPKLVVADFSLNSFNLEENPIYSPVDYFPYMNNETVNNILSKYNKRARLWKYFPFMEICEASEMQKVQAVLGLLGKKERLAGYKGYKENGLSYISPESKYEDKFDFRIDTKGLDILRQLIYTCKQNNIQLLFTYSPEFYLLHHKTEDNFFKTINSICKKNNIVFLNYRHHNICKQNTFFTDLVHLNTLGAKAFSISLAHDINNQFQLSKKQFNTIYYTQNGY